jgi:predicted metal-dependent phosphotriesterase family hydrolase
MRENGFTNAEINQIMIENPKEAFRIRVKQSE